MKDFRYLSYYTAYSVSGTINKRFGVEACFAYVFNHRGFMNNKYVIRIYEGLAQAKKSNNNSCLIPINLIHHHIKIIRRFWPFYYSIDTKMDKELHTYYELTLKLSAKDVIHKIILTWIRYLYEWPYNLYLVDLYRIKKMDEFKYCNPMNLFALIMSCNCRGEGIHAITSCWDYNKFISYHKIINEIKKFKRDGLSISDIFHSFTIDRPNRNDREDNNLCNIEWINDNLFNERVKKYKEALDFLKKHKI